MAVEVYEHDNINEFEEYAEQINSWSCGLWWGDFEEAGIERCYVAFDGDEPVGFQSVNGDGLCVAIEVKEEYQGKGVASALIEESGAYRPDRDENPEFWEAMSDKFGY
jgi:GNAT superfamily N-acetyltransferase